MNQSNDIWTLATARGDQPELKQWLGVPQSRCRDLTSQGPLPSETGRMRVRRSGRGKGLLVQLRFKDTRGRGPWSKGSPCPVEYEFMVSIEIPRFYIVSLNFPGPKPLDLRRGLPSSLAG